VKTFIRELNDTNYPLLPREHYVKLLTWGKWVDRPEKVEKANEKLQKFVKKMSNIYKDTFDYLIETLNLVSQYESVNRMSSAALSIVIGPNLFDPSSTMKGLHENNITNRLLAYLIENHSRVFVSCRTNGTKLGTSADQSNSSQERLLDVVDGSLTRSNKSRKKKQRIEDENKNMRKTTIESLTFQHTNMRRESTLEQPTPNVVTNLINKQFEQFILRDEPSTVDLVSYTELSQNKISPRQSQSAEQNGQLQNGHSQTGHLQNGHLQNGHLKSESNSHSQSTSLKNSQSSSNSTSITSKSIILKQDPAKKRETQNSQDSNKPSGPKGKRPPSKTYIQKKSSRGDVFDEFSTRQIHNVGRVESMREPNSQKTPDSKIPQKSEYSVDIPKTGNYSSAKSSRPLSATSTSSNKFHAIEMAINSESVTQNLEAGDALMSEKPKKVESIHAPVSNAPVSNAHVTIAPVSIASVTIGPTTSAPTLTPEKCPPTNHSVNNTNVPQRVSNLNIATIAPSPQLIQRAESTQNQVSNLSPQQQQRLNELARAMDKIVAEIKKSRIDKSRPEKHENMSKQELLDEKQELQKLLLQFEEEYNRPNQSHEKNVVRVVYDMYRNVKRHLSVVNSGATNSETDNSGTLRRNPGSILKMAKSDTRNSVPHLNSNQHNSNFVTPMVSNNNSVAPSRQVSVISRPGKMGAVIHNSSSFNRPGSSSQRAIDEVLNTLRSKSLDELKSLLRISEQEHSRMQSRANQTNQDIAKMFSSYQKIHSDLPTEQVLSLVKNHPDYVKQARTYEDLKNRIEQLRLRIETTRSTINDKEKTE